MAIRFDVLGEQLANGLLGLHLVQPHDYGSRSSPRVLKPRESDAWERSGSAFWLSGMVHHLTHLAAVESA